MVHSYRIYSISDIAFQLVRRKKRFYTENRGIYDLGRCGRQGKVIPNH
jgi:hypothetical protein